MDDEDDFLPAAQRGRCRPSQSSQSAHKPQPSNTQQDPLSELRKGFEFLLGRFQEVTGESIAGAPKGSGAPKKEKKPKVKEDTKIECHLCHKMYSSKTYLFRHYRAIHAEMNPEKFLGCTVDSTVINLDATQVQENECSICGYVGSTRNALDVHNAAVHGNVRNVGGKEHCNVCGFEASSKGELDIHSRSHAPSNDSVNAVGSTGDGDGNSKANETLKDKTYECVDCQCYFVKKSIFDEHMKVHGYEVVCKICNKNLWFKDIDDHVKNTHPGVYGKKKKIEDNEEEVILEKTSRSRSGRKLRVFICTKCNSRFYNKDKALSHARIHTEGLETRTVPGNDGSRVVNNEQTNDVLAVDNYIFICEACEIATASYDTVVDHSQSHITNPNIQFSYETCERCDLKFGPVCYGKHLDRHYRDKNLSKESFTRFVYKYHLLLSDNWLHSLNIRDAEINGIVSKSIYENTRSVKMRAISVSGTSPCVFNLYQCSQCDNFVDPTSVTNHTLNYDTCKKIKNNFPCHLCKRSFNSRLARFKHVKAHNGNESFRIVIFNTEIDKDINKRLNNTNLATDGNETRTGEVANTINAESLNNNGNCEKVIYKCLCGLCFVRKETANNHTRVCPGNDPKMHCHKCNNLFNLRELVTHCFEHHLNETTTFIIKDIFPEVIDISDDEENKVEQPENTGNNDLDGTIIEVLDSDEEIDKQNSNTMRTSQGVDSVSASGSIHAEVSRITITKNEDVFMDEGNENEISNDDNDSSNDPMTEETNHNYNELINDGDSQDIIVTGALEEAIDHREPSLIKRRYVLDSRDELKCVPTDLLINPFHFAGNSVIQANEILSFQIEKVRLQVETLNANDIKQETPRLNACDPTDFSYIYRRPSLRPMEMPKVTSTYNLVATIEDLVTDDEETQIIQNESDSNNEGNSSQVSPSLNHSDPEQMGFQVCVAAKDNNNKTHYIARTVNSGFSVDTVFERSSIIDQDQSSIQSSGENRYNLQNDKVSNSNIVRNGLQSDREMIRFDNIETAQDIFEGITIRETQNKTGKYFNSMSIVSGSRPKEGPKVTSTVLTDKHAVNIDNIKNEVKVKTNLLAQNEQNIEMENCDDFALIEVKTEPNETNAVVPYRNRPHYTRQGDFVANNIDRRASHQNIVMKDSCVIC